MTLVSEEHSPAVNIQGWWGVPMAVRKAGQVKVLTWETLGMKLRCLGASEGTCMGGSGHMHALMALHEASSLKLPDQSKRELDVFNAI
jgi:hypothetical protein